MPDPFVFVAALLLLPIVALLRFVGCAALLGFDDLHYIPAPVVKVSPDGVGLGPGETQQFTVLVDADPSTEIRWSPNAPNGLYTAPDPKVADTDTVTATSTKVSTSKGSVTVNLIHATVSVNQDAAPLKPGQTRSFTADVQHTPDKAVDWSSNGNPPGIVPTGINTATYTAPGPFVLGSSPVTVTAASKADPVARATSIVNLIGNGARFVPPPDNPDTTTKGDWSPTFGNAGFVLAAPAPVNPALVKLPSYLPGLDTSSLEVFPIPDPTPDLRGLLKPPLKTARFINLWFHQTANIPLDLVFEFNDFEAHRVSIYFVDWDRSSRVQKIEILDGSQVLDTRTLSNFGEGQYLMWDLSGKVLLRITHVPDLPPVPNKNVNAVFSGIFFD